jgi:DNA-binding transcriptional LysR family regulator
VLDIDLKLLSILEEIYRTKSVSQAADNLQLSQPTVSIGLAKLRKFFNDSLFVRTSTGMEPTPRMQSLHPPLSQALSQLKTALRDQVEFDPSTSVRSFRLCVTDISQIVLVPRLLEYLGSIAPTVAVDIIDIGPDTGRLLETGDADLAIGFLPQLEAGFYQQTLFGQRYVCMVRKDHPRIDGKPTVKQFEREAHVQVLTSGTGHTIIDKVLEQRGVTRRIALRVPNFLGIALIVASTDLIVTVPTRLAEAVSGTASIRIVEPPVAFPSYDVKQHWHERYHLDPRSQWLRKVVARLFLETKRRVRSASPAG